MQCRIWLAVLLVSLFVLPLGSTAVASSKTDTAGVYVLGAGDILDISVWKDDALTRSLVVLPDGSISFPLIGEVKAEGRTLAELHSELEKKLSRYVPDPVLSVNVRQVNSMLIYVIGRVKSPGRYNINSDVNVLQALATAGGLDPFAKQDDIKIYRNGQEDKEVLPFRYSAVIKGEHLGDNVVLRRGDVIVVP